MPKHPIRSSDLDPPYSPFRTFLKASKMTFRAGRCKCPAVRFRAEAASSKSSLSSELPTVGREGFVVVVVVDDDDDDDVMFFSLSSSSSPSCNDIFLLLLLLLLPRLFPLASFYFCLGVAPLFFHFLWVWCCLKTPTEKQMCRLSLAIQAS